MASAMFFFCQHCEHIFWIIMPLVRNTINICIECGSALVIPVGSSNFWITFNKMHSVSCLRFQPYFYFRFHRKRLFDNVFRSFCTLLSPVFDSRLLWPNDWMDEDTTCYRSRPQRSICIRQVPSAPQKGHSIPPLLKPCLLWPRSPISATAQLLYKLSPKNLHWTNTYRWYK